MSIRENGERLLSRKPRVRLISRGVARKTAVETSHDRGLAWLFVLGRIYGFVRWRTTMVSSRLTNVPRLNLKPPASRSLPVDYGPDKSFLENGHCPLYLSFPFVSALTRHPSPMTPVIRNVYLLDSCSRGNRAVVYINSVGPLHPTPPTPARSVSLAFLSCFFFRGVFQFVVFGDGPGIESLSSFYASLRCSMVVEMAGLPRTAVVYISRCARNYCAFKRARKDNALFYGANNLTFFRTIKYRSIYHRFTLAIKVPTHQLLQAILRNFFIYKISSCKADM